MKTKNLKNLIIIGAGSFGREAYVWAKQSKENGLLWQVKGFLDDNKNALAGYSYEVGVVSSVKEYKPKLNDVFICPMGNPKIKKKLVSMILKKRGVFTNVTHSTVVLGKNVKLGIGIILCPYSVISSDSVIGDFVSVNLHANIGHDVRVGDWCFIGPGASLNGRVILEKSVFIGSHGVVLPGGYVSKEAMVAAGSVVVGKIGVGVTVIGVPAKPLHFPKKLV